MANAPLDMDFASLLVQADDLPSFEDYVEPLCNEMLAKIAALRRKAEVNLKQQGIQVRKEVRNVWPGYAAEYRKLLTEKPPGGERVLPHEEYALLGEAGDDNSLQLSFSTSGITTSNSDLFAGFASSTSRLEERIDWRINFAQGPKAKDSKLFFFGTVLFRLSFGLRPSSTHHYIHLAPAEKLAADVRLHCTYHILDPATDIPLMTQVAEDNYLFRSGHQDIAGIEHFIGVDLNQYLDGSRRLSLSVVVATEVGRQGQMLGLTFEP
jgi:hypothetical protein